jgi:hypothetical protein
MSLVSIPAVGRPTTFPKRAAHDHVSARAGPVAAQSVQLPMRDV